EARLVGCVERPEPHRDRGELPELRHQTRVWIARTSLAPRDLTPEVVELGLAQASFEERARVTAGGGMPLEVDLVARTFVFAAEEVVEAHLVEAGGRGVGAQVAADPREQVVRPQHHHRGVPADDAPYPKLHPLVAREFRLLLGRDRVDVWGVHERTERDVELAR